MIGFSLQAIITMLKVFANVCKVYLTHKYDNRGIFAVAIGCKGICTRLETTGGGKYSAYTLGYKRCSSCNLFIKTDQKRCPCCKLPLRVKKRCD
jgi:hypothetical protein